MLTKDKYQYERGCFVQALFHIKTKDMTLVEFILPFHPFYITHDYIFYDGAACYKTIRTFTARDLKQDVVGILTTLHYAKYQLFERWDPKEQRWFKEGLFYN